ncbi:hypothetical protein OTU49_013157 [Cherax quadricarinatus]|uniref:DRBM domain-containing protein n=1 Tax=Cherax quadricarinatus TaxID=27406 RepID=A0AAW0VUV4_CHEQU
MEDHSFPEEPMWVKEEDQGERKNAEKAANRDGKGNGDAGHQNGHRDGGGGVMAGQENGEGDRVSPLKRSATNEVEMSAEPQGEPITKRRKTGPPQPKNPISTLNELRPGLVYNMLGMEGPSHAPVFTVTVEISGQVFRGSGRSKKQAKHSAAEAALRSFLQFRNASDAAEALGINITAVQDFTSDVSEAGFGSNSTVGEWWREAWCQILFRFGHCAVLRVPVLWLTGGDIYKTDDNNSGLFSGFQHSSFNIISLRTITNFEEPHYALK